MPSFDNCVICGEDGAPWQPNGEFRHFTCWERRATPTEYDVHLIGIDWEDL